MKLVKIPPQKYYDYKCDVMFNAFKWDPQVGDTVTIADNILVIEQSLATKLENMSEKLAKETTEIEEYLLNNPTHAQKLGLHKDVLLALKEIKNYDRNKHIRLMRFDFHPTAEGFKVSEVNSDVPAGAAESSILPNIAKHFFEQGYTTGGVIEAVTDSLLSLVKPYSKVGFVYSSKYVEDKQVLVGFENALAKNNIDYAYLSPNEINWRDNKPYILQNNQEQELDAIMRYYPAEWLSNYAKYNWKGYFTTNVTSCNHPISLYSQSKRLPLIWDDIGLDLPTWRQLLPKTTAPRLDNFFESDWVYKPAMSRVGDGISIREAISDKEYKDIIKQVKKKPQNWVSQKKFTSVPIVDEIGDEYHVCIGVFTVNGKSAGFYGRLSKLSRVDDKAIDVPILINKDEV